MSNPPPPLDRREFLRQVVATGFALTLSPLIPAPSKPTGGSQGAGVPVLDPDMSGARLRDQWRMHELTEGWRRAAATGRPLLIIIVPQDPARARDLGDAWGEVITAGSDEAIAALVAVELVTATQDELHTVLPAYRIETVQTEPLLVRIEAAEMPARYEAFTTALFFPTTEDWNRVYELSSYEERDRVIDGWITTRIASLDALILSATRPDPTASRRVREAELAARREAPIPGARWGRHGSCGSDFREADPLEAEGSGGGWDAVGYLCGMGHVDSRTARFLDFLTDDPQNPVGDFLEKQRGG